MKSLTLIDQFCCLDLEMKVLSFVFISLVTLTNLISSQKSLSEKCETCKSFTKKFIDGLDRTKKGNFGGGNTG